MAAPRKYTDQQREAIRRLVQEEGHSYAKAAELCANGVYDLEPFAPSKATIAEIINGSEKPSKIAALQLDVAFDQLARGAMSLIETEIERLKNTEGALDTDAMLKMARSLRELQPLAKPQAPNPNGKETEPKTLLGSMGNASRQNAANGHHNGTVTPLRPDTDRLPPAS